MPSIHKRAGSPYWWAAFYQPDGRRAFRSTAKSNRREAMEVCLKYAEAARLAKEQRLTEYRAREVIADIFHVGNADRLPAMTVRQYIEAWIAKKALELADKSLQEYRKTTGQFTTHLGVKADKPIDAITVADVTTYRTHLSEQVRGGTVNKAMKILRSAWTQAVKDGLARENIFSRVGLVKADRSERRAFSLPEIQRILQNANNEWRGVILTALYTGQRLDDVACLTWRNVDLEQREIRLETGKTGRRMVIPIARPLHDYLIGLDVPDDPAAPVFPKASATPGGTLSNQFNDILADAGLRPPVSHRKKKAGAVLKGRRRKVHDISFHALRHTATSLLKNAGVSDVVAREIIGHDSAVVSRHYTHIETDTLRSALDRLPDVTAAQPKLAGKQRT